MPVGHIRYRFGLFETDFANGRVLRQGAPVRLQEQPFQVLLALLERHGELVSRDELRDRLWPGDTFVEFDKSLGVAIVKLRSALGDDAANPLFIETIARRGYRFIAPVAVECPAPSDLPMANVATADIPVSHPSLAPPVDRSAVSTPLRWSISPRLVRVAGAVLVAGALGLFWSVRHGSHALSAGRASIVIAEFANATGDDVFSGSLRRAAVVALGQSPFLTVIPDADVRAGLQALGRAPDEPLTAALARDVCRRAGAAALVDGQIGRAGADYLLVVEATRCSDGSQLAHESQPVAKKEDVLPGLGGALARLRATLGESRASLDSYNRPLEVATTDSLDALRAYQLGMDLRGRGDNLRAIPALKTAVALDPQFALAYAQLGSAYSNQGETASAIPLFRKAFELRDRATEPERFYITGRYFDIVTGELENASETYRSWTQIYPDSWVAFNALANDANLIGRYGTAVDAAARAVQIDPRQGFAPVNLMDALTAEHRFDEAKRVAAGILQGSPDDESAHETLYAIAIFEDDAEGRQRETEWASKHADVTGMTYVRAENAAGHGRLRESTRLFRDVARRNRADGNDQAAATALIESAEFNALVGNADLAHADAATALALGTGEIILGLAALIEAQTGRFAAAQQQLDALGRDFPVSVFDIGVFAPAVRGAMASASGRSSDDVIGLMAGASPYELGQVAGLLPIYVRGSACLETRAPALAAPEFQRILDHAGVDPVTPLYQLAYLGLARANAALGKKDQSAKAYQTFLAFWKDADPDVPLLAQARREAAAIR